MHEEILMEFPSAISPTLNRIAPRRWGLWDKYFLEMCLKNYSSSRTEGVHAWWRGAFKRVGPRGNIWWTLQNAFNDYEMESKKKRMSPQTRLHDRPLSLPKATKYPTLATGGSHFQPGSFFSPKSAQASACDAAPRIVDGLVLWRYALLVL